MKQGVRNTIKIISFLLIGTFLFLCFLRAFHFKSGRNIEFSYDLPKNSVDVLIAGSSHATVDIDPGVLYAKSGITGYTLGTQSEYMWLTYYHVREMLKRQQPKVLMLESLMVINNDSLTNDSVLIPGLSGMRLSGNFIDAVRNSVPEEYENKINYYLMFPF